MALTIQQYAERLKKLLEASKSKAMANVMIPSANRLLATVKNRIMLDGENTQGGQIGQYSTKPMYASKEQFDKPSAFKPIKKKYVSTDAKAPKTAKGRNVLATVHTETGKTMYLREGYRELRQIQGKRVDKVNLNYRGDLMREYVSNPVSDTVIEQGLLTEMSKKKREGNEKRFGGKILTPQPEEIEQYKKSVSELTKLEIQKIMGTNA